jgi:predicted HAD superfamily Cof-like phosphohydrolase
MTVVKKFITVGVEVPDNPEGWVGYGKFQEELTLMLSKHTELGTRVLSDEPYHIELGDVFQFHNKFQVPMASEPSLLDLPAHLYRRNFLKEELQEFDQAYATKNIHEAGDALVDLVYVAIGTALMMGLPWAKMWATVQRVNMTKRLAKPDGSDSKRNNPLDVIKPEGFKPADHWEALGDRARRSPVFDATAAVLALAERRRQSVSDVEAKPEPDAAEASDGTPAPSPSV